MGTYLLINPINLYGEMIPSSPDNGPVEKNPQDPGRVTFRFKAEEWEGKIKKLLYLCPGAGYYKITCISTVALNVEKKTDTVELGKLKISGSVFFTEKYYPATKRSFLGCTFSYPN